MQRSFPAPGAAPGGAVPALLLDAVGRDLLHNGSEKCTYWPAFPLLSPLPTLSTFRANSELTVSK